ncbi:hypothetical protein ACS0TY_018907 [Phlomoides rotata]
MEILQSPLTISCCVVVLICFWKFLSWAYFTPKKLEKSLRKQGFSGNPLLGDLREIAQMEKESLSKPMIFSNDIVPRIMPFVHKITTSYGQKCFMWLGRSPAVFISDPENIREILAKSNVFQKTENVIGKMLAKGLINYNNDKWAKHRRLITPAFQLQKVKLMLPSFYLSCCEMLSKWEKITQSEGSTFELDVSPHLETLTSDAISRTAFGSSYEEGRKIFQLQKELATLLLQESLLFFIPGLRFLPTKTNRKMKHIRKEVGSLVLGMIGKRKKSIEAGECSTNNLLDILLESNFKETKQNGSKFGMSLEDVVEECKLFYIAGQETTSSLLVWTMILLSKHLDWQARAREEVRETFGGREPDFEELNRLKTVNMILYEVLRLYPPVVILHRTIHKETTLGIITLPAGVMLIMPTILLHHDRKIWGDDVEEFNPERFSEGVSRDVQLTYFPFGSGTRVCIGQNFAMLEAKMALAMILRHYSFELSPSYSHAPHEVVTLQPQHGAHLILHKL